MILPVVTTFIDVLKRAGTKIRLPNELLFAS